MLDTSASKDDAFLDEAQQETRQWLVDFASSGVRLDRFLAQQVTELSRSYLQQLIDEGLLTRNGQVCSKAATKLKAGDQLSLVLRATAQSQAFIAQDIPIDVVYEDAHLLVVHKPAGMVVHPAPGNWTGTLLNALLHRYQDAVMLPRAGIVHRLDKDTSGLMVVARTRQSMDLLIQMIAARQVQRQYWALAHGRWRKSHEVVAVNAAIGRDPRNRLRMAVVDLATQSGKEARTDFMLIAQGEDAFWVQAKLHTGRTHQIRVHMQHLAHPLLADALYGGREVYGMQRQALHAFSLAFLHPITQEPLQFKLSLPQDMQQAVSDLGLTMPEPPPVFE